MTDEKKKGKNVFVEFGEQVGEFANRTIDSIKNTIDGSIGGRNTVLSIRISEETSDKLGMLVEAGLFKSKSESAAFLIDEGIKKQSAMFDKIVSKMDEITKLRDDLKNIIKEEIVTEDPPSESAEEAPKETTKRPKKKTEKKPPPAK